MKIAVFSCQEYEKEALLQVAKEKGVSTDEFVFFHNEFEAKVANLATGCDGVILFVTDTADAAGIKALHDVGVKVIFLRCAGFDNVDLEAAKAHDMLVLRVPAYAPSAIAEHAAALMLTLNRKTHRAFNRTREANYKINGLMGFGLSGRTVGIIGTGKIGALFAKICNGFGCQVIGYDVVKNPEAVEAGLKYVSKEELFAQSDIISLHCPLTDNTYHIIDEKALEQMKPGVMILNTGRGALVSTKAVLEGLKSGKIGYLGLDVIENEKSLLYKDNSTNVVEDDFARLVSFPNVLLTGHQAFFTDEGVAKIAETTIENIQAFEKGGPYPNKVTEQDNAGGI